MGSVRMRWMLVRRGRCVVLMRVRRMGMLMMLVAGVKMTLLPMRFVQVKRLGCLKFFSNDVYFGCGQSSAAHLAHLQMRAHVQHRSGFCKGVKGNARVDKGAQQHVAAYAGKTLKISNSHRE